MSAADAKFSRRRRAFENIRAKVLQENDVVLAAPVRNCRSSTLDEGPVHTLTKREEYFLVNGIAYLASAPRWRGVTAVAMEEVGGEALPGLRFCVAANENRGSDDPVSFVRELFTIVSPYARAIAENEVEVLAGEEVLEALLGAVVRFAKLSVLQRVGSSSAAVLWARGGQVYKCDPLDLVLSTSLPALRQEQSRLRLERLIRSLQRVRRMPEDEVCAPGVGLKRVESCLRRAHRHQYPNGIMRRRWPRNRGLDNSRAYQRAMGQVEKLAQYIEACKDIMCLAERYPLMFLNTEVFACPKPQADILSNRMRIATHNVHVEMWIMAYYATKRLARPPRQIGCNKLACYDCHAFIRAEGRYGLPGSHGKSYVSWTLPVVSLGEARKTEWARVLKKMTWGLENVLNTRRNHRFPKESVPPSSQMN